MESNRLALTNYPDDKKAEVIAHNRKGIKLDPFEIATSYKNWVESRPFDIGNNTRATIGTMHSHKVEGLVKFAMEKGAQSTKSCSNGSLMRIAPLAIWTSNIEDLAQLQKIISLDVSFTHSN